MYERFLVIDKIIHFLKTKIDDKRHPYYIICDNALVLFVSAFES